MGGKSRLPFPSACARCAEMQTGQKRTLEPNDRLIAVPALENVPDKIHSLKQLTTRCFIN